MPLINKLNLNPRAFVGASLLTVMVVSLACSMSLQYGHADVPIAATAEEARCARSCSMCSVPWWTGVPA